MTVVSSKEFVGNDDKYFDIALTEQVCIQKGDNMFFLIYKNTDNHDASVYEEVLEPDDDFRRAIAVDDFFDAVKENIRKKYASSNNA